MFMVARICSRTRYVACLLALARFAVALTISAATASAAGGQLEFRQGDRIAIIGNGLADRMQHSGHLETMLHQQFPAHDLVVRHLGFAGDELVTRMRSENFGSPDEWLTKVQADVVLAFFGFNESFKGQEGLPKFRTDLEKFIKDTLKQNYNGKAAPRLVLFSPVAAERHQDPNFPDPDPINHTLKYYVDAMADVARANNVPFVDLFAPSQKAYAAAKESLTVNGVHLRDAGYQALAPAMFEGLLGRSGAAMSGEAFEKLRAAVNEKNAVWFSRYRTVDGYNVYGGRSRLSFPQTPGGPKISNFDVMQAEMSQRDVMTANRDKRVWAVAKGGDLVVKDDNLPEAPKLETNKPGKNPDGSHEFISGQDAIKHMKVPPGVKVSLVADEAMYRELAKPVQMAFDTKGRLWVAAWPSYPERTPTSTVGDKLLVFDLDENGRATKCTTFLDDLNCPTGFQFYKDGVIVVQAPDVWFVRDTNGDGKADWKERILNGLDSADSHHTANSICYEPGGAIYLSDGVFHRTQVETARGVVRNTDGAIYRFEPRTGKFERHIAYGFANPHGRVFDRWGNDLVTDATGNNTYFGPAFSGYIDYPAKHASMKQFWERPARPCPGTGILSSRHWPDEFQDNFLNINVIGFQGIYRVKVAEEGSGLAGTTLQPHLVESTDPNFRPIAIDVAPDGSIYFLDWHNPIIGHMQHHIRDPNRDHVHGRIYRMTYEGRPLVKAPKVDGQPIPALLDLLKEPEDNTRTRAKIELDKHPSKQVIAAAQQWVKQFDAKKVEDQHHILEALWLHQWHNVVNEPLLRQVLQSPEPRARAQAVRVLGYWSDRVSQPLEALRIAANDSHPRVRLEALRVASFFEGNDAMDVAYETTKHPSDYYIDYTFKETTKQLQKSTKGYLPKDARVLALAVNKMSDKELAAAPAVEPVLIARIERKTTDLNTRNSSLEELAKLRKTDRITEAVETLKRLDEPEVPIQTVKDIATLLTAIPGDLPKARAELARLSSDTHQPAIRRAAYAALVACDGKPDGVWASTANTANSRVALVDSIIMLANPADRANFQPLLESTIADAKAPSTVREAALRALPLMGSDHAAKNFGLLVQQIRSRQNLSTAARSLMQIPRDSWVKQEAAPASEAILTWARNVPENRRTTPEFVETVQLGMEMAGLMPAAEATRVRKELLGLGVRIFSIKTVREQMRFDTTRIVVEAGKPFEIMFENDDMMPHNLVVLQPGSREEVGTIADKMQPVMDKQGRMYVPNSKRVLASTKLLEPSQLDTIKMTAPNVPGKYEYVCTYPEHWKNMFGELIVVKDIEEFLKQSATQTAQAPARLYDPLCTLNPLAMLVK
jgi:azurin